MTVRQLLFTLCLLAASLPLSAQFGVSGHYRGGNPYASRDGNAGADFYPLRGPEISLDVWFRLKQTRIEFLPTISYGQNKSDGQPEVDIPGITGRQFSLFFNTNFYLFDIKGDCGCPTFKKEGPALQKGFFLQVGPGYVNHAINLEGGRRSEQSFAAHNFSLNLGLGLDIGISELITLSPYAGVRYFPSFRDGGYVNVQDGDRSSFTQPRAGLRVGFRFDE
ncbi:MAG: autotransporter domain-containing protein [Saprospiraceae bacterium]